MLKKNENAAEAIEVFDPNVSKTRLKTWFPDLTDSQVASLVIYLTELNKFNRSLNLVSASTLKNAEAILIADGIHAARHIFPSLIEGQPLYDFGSGNGCPALIFAALLPQKKVVLVDRDQKKLEFCKQTAQAMGLANIEFLLKGVEELPAASIVNVVARGSAPLAKILIKYRHQLPKGGKFFHMKGDGWANELASLPSQVFSHWTPSVMGKYFLPESSVEMFVVLTEKIMD